MNELSNQKRTDGVNIVFLVSVAAGLCLQVLAVFTNIFDNVLVNILVSQATVVVPAAVWFSTKKINPIKEMRVKPLGIGVILKIIVFAVLLNPVLTFFNAISMVFSENMVSNVMFDVMASMPYLGALSLMALLPAICEETFYRGMLYHTYRRVSPWKAVFLSAFLFGIMHGNLNQFTYAFVMGVVFALLIEATDSIVSTMLVHFIFNATSVSSLYLLPRAYEAIKNIIANGKANGTQGVEELELTYTQLFGDLSMSTEEWMNQMFNSASQVDFSFGSVIVSYLPSAMLCGCLAYMVFKSISKSCGTWNRFRTVYMGAQDAPVKVESKSTYGTEKTTEVDDAVGDSSVNLMTNPLFIGIALCIALIFFVTTLPLLPMGK